MFFRSMVRVVRLESKKEPERQSSKSMNWLEVKIYKNVLYLLMGLRLLFYMSD